MLPSGAVSSCLPLPCSHLDLCRPCAGEKAGVGQVQRAALPQQDVELVTPAGQVGGEPGPVAVAEEEERDPRVRRRGDGHQPGEGGGGGHTPVGLGSVVEEHDGLGIGIKHFGKEILFLEKRKDI